MLRKLYLFGKFKQIPKKYSLSVFCLIVLVLIAVILTSKTGDLGTEESKVSAANYYRNGDFENAAKKYAEDYKANPKNPKNLAGVIESIAAIGNRSGTESQAYESAKPYLEKASKVKDRDVYNAVGYLLEASGRYQEALENYEKAIAEDKDFANSWFHKGHVLEFLGKKEESVKAYEKAFELASDDPRVMLSMARQQFLSGKISEAYDLFIEVSKANASNSVKAEALANAAYIKRSQGYIEEALDLSTRAISQDRKSSYALSNHGINLVVTGKIEGFQFLEDAKRANVRAIQPYWWIGISYRSVKKYDEAILNMRKALEMVDNDNTIVGQVAVRGTKAMLSYDLAKTYAVAGKNQEAINLLEEAIKLEGNIKEKLKSDAGSSFFKNLQDDADFQALLR